MSAVNNTKASTSVGRVRKKNQSLILKAASQDFLAYGFKGASIKSIAERAGIPRANVHYYYKNKEAIYTDILSEIVELWDSSILTSNNEPAKVLGDYIYAKVMYSHTNPEASRIFASEFIHGAPRLQSYLNTHFKKWIDDVKGTIQGWIDQGKMDDIDPLFLLFTIWGSTQHYADFEPQVTAAMGKDTLTDADFENIAKTLTYIILKGCGIK
ncbi:TetR/AcrR family transcriptional regulator [Thalassotalea profundi]|uniref:TetR family transcriptional regulator n=1 Tax=Thalassotalea profundi TaxID=2036687 RepID=A0ABQ3ILI0_9GAMM|nr:TetR/AcrR family transcriptional regulator [Thalassotalea profundi]GHE82854.1 TetR family transcriptional regulator [Thalassotalea profundi]